MLILPETSSQVNVPGVRRVDLVDVHEVEIDPDAIHLAVERVLPVPIPLRSLHGRAFLFLAERTGAALRIDEQERVVGIVGTHEALTAVIHEVERRAGESHGSR